VKERKIIITIEALSNIPIKEFSIRSIQEMFDEHFTNDDEVNREALTVNHVKAVVSHFSSIPY